MKYRPEIDGLRALAVVPVVFFHAGFTLFSGGYVGVDVFFVISGYLITDILLSDLAAERFSVLRFYERRARRILPALFAVLVVCLPFAWTMMLPSEFEEFNETLLGTLGFVSNFVLHQQSGYFALAADQKPLIHTWSLAVEEQFYLLFPAFLFLVFQKWPHRLLTAFAIVGAASLIAAHLIEFVDPAANFFLLPSRIWELLAGGACAIVLRRGMPIRKGVGLDGLGMAMIIASCLFFDSQTPYPSFATLLPVGGTVLIILFARPDRSVGRFLSLPPMVGVGLVSYSFYLWHQPLFAFSRLYSPEGAPSPILLLALSVAALGLAVLSWRFIEQPFRDRRTLSPAAIRRTGAALAMVLALCGTVGLVAPERQQTASQSLLNAQARNNAIRVHAMHEAFENWQAPSPCHLDVVKNGIAAVERELAPCVTRFGKAIVIVGDSHGESIYRGLAALLPDRTIVSFAQSGCQAAERALRCKQDEIADFLNAHTAQVDRVIFHQSGSYLIADPTGEVDSSDAFASPASFTLQPEGIADIVDFLGRFPQSVDTVWLGPFKEFRHRLDIRTLQQQRFNEVSILAFDRLEDVIGRTLAATGSRRFGFRYVPIHPLIDDLYGSVLAGDCLIVRDSDHWSSCGEKLVAERLIASGLVPKNRPDSGAFAKPISANRRAYGQ